MDIIHQEKVAVRNMFLRLSQFDSGNVLLSVENVTGLDFTLHLNQTEVAGLIAGLTGCLRDQPKGRIIARVHVGKALEPVT
jgi:hypothetical protein